MKNTEPNSSFGKEDQELENAYIIQLNKLFKKYETTSEKIEEISANIFRTSLKTIEQIEKNAHEQVILHFPKEEFSNIKKAAYAQKRKINRQKLQLYTLVNPLDQARKFYEIQPFFYDLSGIFWFWNEEETKWNRTDEVDLINSIEYELSLNGSTVKSKKRGEILQALKMVGRQNQPEEAPKEWVQFKDKIFDFKTKKIFDAKPTHFICNPIPHKIGSSNETPVMNKLFTEWVGEKYIKTLYEIIAYCCLTDYPIHLLFCFIGSGRNGKSKYQQLLIRFLGVDNICSTELDQLLESRFETAKLYKKLACMLGETNFGTISKTSLLKKLTGQDTIGYEFKNKQPFDDYNYAKIIVNSNSLPSSDDTSEGFYRRWLIIDFPNSFKEGRDILQDIPDEEYENLCKKVIETLPNLMKTGFFTNQGSIEERRERYIMASNPLPLFINKCCSVGESDYMRYSELYTVYCKFLKMIKRRIVSRKEFKKCLDSEGLEQRKTSKKIGSYDNFGKEIHESGYWIEGISLNKNWEECAKELVLSFFTIEVNAKQNSFPEDFHENVDNCILATSISTGTGVNEKMNKGGIQEVEGLKVDYDIYDNYDVKSTQPLRKETNSKNTHKCHKCPKIFHEILEKSNGNELEIQILIDVYGIDEKTINEAKKNGDVFECRPGFIKKL